MDFSTQTFHDALRVAGLAGLPLAFGSDGTILGKESLSQEQQTALDAVVAAYDPVPEAQQRKIAEAATACDAA